MARPRHRTVELRSYDLTDDLQLQIHKGDNWRLSPVRSTVLHFHNCFEIGICLSESAHVCFGDEEMPVRAGDVVCVARNVAHTIWSQEGRQVQSAEYRAATTPVRAKAWNPIVAPLF